ncbi:iron-sulfur cluster assembly scaffold protein [Xiamenia xianingshaonis]|uniref:Iron-sulfur cluster assembly scaffold protein n=1 Tax=Xiamenia xianingshaonis TaxID=2682776 RepID=A0A9E6SUN2_9ACTN|nr:iron-sulfur cluster assembly scaffold protein [Xiamenia xianingshaonis]NHM13898.1 iron-sulfur cluster assembly scaffold protein [Xiamenia xianingshaonis]QTU84412.1 iron-sulfur cluster assembly scaffold protein [Xiamenia xianingshaonis]
MGDGRKTGSGLAVDVCRRPKSGRESYLEPEERMALRTADVYQVDKDVDTLNYSEKLLSIVATFKNSGRPEGFNAQSMVGRSKRGEVALRLFAVVEGGVSRPPRFARVGFKSRGCLAMTACASAICDLVEGLTFEEALAITPDQVKDAVGGVPWDKLHTPVFAVEAVRGLVGDWLIRQGATFSELEAKLPCDPLSPGCLVCEHCSLRDFRTDLRMDALVAKAKARS